MQKRSIVKAVIFSLITCGIYGCYWFVKLTDEAHEAAGRQTTASGLMALLFSLVTCGIYLLYWMYKMGETVNEAKHRRGMHADGNDPILYLFLTFVGLGIVSEALIQSALNDIVAFDENTSGGEIVLASENLPGNPQ